MSKIAEIISSRQDNVAQGATPTGEDDFIDMLKALDCLTESINGLVVEIKRQQGR